MGVLSGIKKALSAVGRWDKRQFYGDDYEQKMEALGRLSQLNEEGISLANQGKYLDIQRMRSEMEQGGIKDAIELEGQLPSQEDPSFVGPRLEDVNLPNPGGEGLLDGGDRASEIFNVPAKFRPVVRAAGGARRSVREQKEREDRVRSNAMLEATAALTRQREASADKLDRTPVGGGATSAFSAKDHWVEGPDGRPIFGKQIVMRDGTTRFVPNEGGSRPTNSGMSQTDRNAIVGASNTIANLSDVISKMEQVESSGLLGAAGGRLANLNVRYFAGKSLTADQRALIQAIDRTKMMAAFASGGKTLTGTEKQFFDDNFPTLQATDDVKVFIRLARELQKAFEREARKVNQSAPGDRRYSQEEIDRLVGVSTTPKESVREKAKRLGLIK